MSVRLFYASLLLLLIFAAPVQAWEIRTQGPVTISGTGPPPVLVTPPVVPPVVPPPPGPLPVVDNTPFPFPSQCRGENNDPSARYSALVVLSSGSVYAALTEYGNPSPGSHICVGMTAPDARAVYGSPVGNQMLWAPRGTPYGLLRCLLATGRPC